MVAFSDVRSVMTDPNVSPLFVAYDVMDTQYPKIVADATFSDALSAFNNSDLHHLPVVESEKWPLLLGGVSRADLMSRYEQELYRKMAG
jgi:CBS-domain-containing membrane protein